MHDFRQGRVRMTDTRDVSSDEPPNSMLTTASAISSVAFVPMICALQNLVGLGMCQDLHEASRIALTQCTTIGEERI